MSDFDPNTDEGWAASLAAKTGRPAEEFLPESATRDVQAGLESDPEPAPQQEREDEGRFVSEDEPVAEESTETAAPEEDQPEEEQPEADPAQQMIGRQANEIGDLRKQNQELAERLARIEGAQQERERQQPQQQSPAMLPSADDDTMEALETVFQEQGVDSTLAWVIQNRPELFEIALETAPQYGFLPALRWAISYYGDDQAQPQEPQQAPAPAPWEEAQRREAQADFIAGEAATLAGESWERLSPHWGQALQESPPLIQQLVVSPDATTRQQGLQAVQTLAEARAVQAATQAAQAQATQQQATAKRATALATGSQRQVAQAPAVGQTGSYSDDERQAALERFRERIRNAPSTSVADGLREGAGS